MARIGKFFFFDGSENLATVFYYHVRSNGGVVESIGCVDNTSSFLEQSSFLLSPSGYKEDTVYTQKPIGATGNLTFTRGSDAWRTNVQGLLQRTPYNLVQYSNDLSNVSWTKTSVTITPDSTVAPNGTLTADLVTFTTTNGYVLRTQSVAPATQYTFSAYFKNSTFATGETVFFRLSDGVIAPAIATVNIVNKTATYNTNPSAWTNLSGVVEEVGNDWFRVSVTATSVNGGNGWIEVFTNGFAKSLYVWGFQIVEGAYPLEYFPTTDRLDVPRIDYSYGTCPALLLEPQRTNIVLYSEQFDDVSWTKNASTLTPNTTVSPNGNLNADTLSVTTSTYSGVYRTVSGTSAIYTVSVYAKKNTKDWLFLVDVQGTGGRAWFNLNTGVLGTVVSGYTATITNVGNGWYRCTLTNTTAQSAIYHQLGLSDADNTLTPISAGSAFIWGAQLEAGAYPSSYIRTEATTVTRLADSFSRNNIYTNNLITSAGGTWYIQFRVTATERDNSNVLRLGDINNALQINSGLGGYTFIVNKNIAGSGTNVYFSFLGLSSSVKLVIKWNGSTADIFANGTKVVSGTSFTPTTMNDLTCSVGSPLHIQGMALYPVPLDDVDCELLTNPTSSGYSSFASMASSLGYILI